MIEIYINNIKLKVNKNLTVLQACKTVKIEIPKFCFQENLQIAGNCRMCLVEIENSPKPVASCAMPLIPNMKIFTNTPLVQKARESVLEFLLINHPLDCPICDQASECDLQDQTMLFGSDRSRFFFKKRGVEDKFCGPFIKTIMTRCIHCTRCVRFANEICGIDDLGTTGRGNKTEINFYYPKIFNSEFSGNLVDLCPVGALTSKPYAFKARSWELKKKEGVDILDSIGSNIQINIFNNEIVRILPKTNSNINKDWITNKTRYFFDSLKYQRIKYPLLKDDNNKFSKISWLQALNIINEKLITTDSSNIQSIIGDLTDLESLFLLKKNLIKLGISNIHNEYFLKNRTFKINSDISSNILFNHNLNLINESDLCIIINSNIRQEGALLNIHLINRLKKGNFKIAYIGAKTDFTYKVKHLGLTYEVLINIILGKHTFCKNLKQAKKPLIIFGENTINQKNGLYLINKLKNLTIFKNKNNINFFITRTSLINFFEITFSKSNNLIKNSTLYYLFNTNLQNKLKIQKNSFVIYQGHHFTKDAQRSNLILPGLTFLEKKGIYINLEGSIQKNEKILNLNTEQREDSFIYKNIYKFLVVKNQSTTKSFLKFKNLLPYLNKPKINIINNFLNIDQKFFKFNINFLDYLIKNNYYTNILEQYSKILVNANNFSQKQTKKL